MGKIINSPTTGGGTTLDLSFITATSDKILTGYIGSDIEGNPVEGTMVDNGQVTHTLNAGNSYTIPAGYHNGSGVISANILSSQTIADASAGDILTGRTAWVNGAKITGSMPNQGAKTASLNAGGSYTIPAGYHNGSGKVTANSLASQTSATASASHILAGYNAWVNGSKVNGSMPNRGSAGTSLNCGQSYTIPLGYHSGSGKVTANSLASQTSANAAASHIRSGYTAWVNGAKITGNLAIQSALSFSAAALSATSVRISWKNPSKGPWQGVFIQISTSGYPGTGGGTRVYTGAGNNPSSANGSNYVDIGGLKFGTTYYFTCTSYVDALGWGNSYNVAVTTPAASVGDILKKYYSTNEFTKISTYAQWSSVEPEYRVPLSISGNKLIGAAVIGDNDSHSGHITPRAIRLWFKDRIYPRNTTTMNNFLSELKQKYLDKKIIIYDTLFGTKRKETSITSIYAGSENAAVYGDFVEIGLKDRIDTYTFPVNVDLSGSDPKRYLGITVQLP